MLFKVAAAHRGPPGSGRLRLYKSRPYSPTKHLKGNRGAGLVKRITDRNYCGNETSCDSSVDLFDTNFGGTSLGIWLSAYNDLDVVVINNLVIHMGSRIPKMKHAYPDYLKENICDTQLLFHKATDHQMDVIDRREVDAGWQHPTPLKMTHRRWRS